MKVLLISFFYPPLNSIASNRIHAFKKYFETKGIRCYVITRYYDEQQRHGRSVHVYEKPPNGFGMNYFREGDVIYTNYSSVSRPKKIFDLMPPGVKGLFGYLFTDIYSYGWQDYVIEAYKQELIDEEIDLIIGSVGPPIVLRITKAISDSFRVPYLIDYRDIFITDEDTGFHLMVKKFIQNYYLQKASGLIVVSEGMRNYFWRHAKKKLKGLPIHLVMNGIDGELSKIPSVDDMEQVRLIDLLRSDYDYLLLHTGTLYPKQDILLFREFVINYNKKSNHKVALILVGVGELIDSTNLLGPDCYIISKVSQNTSQYLQLNVDALVFPAWPGRYSGFAGKLFEYLASGTKVLVGANVPSDVKEFIRNYSNVFLIATLDQFRNAIECRQEYVSCNDLEKLQRKFWVEQLAKELKSKFG